MKTSGISDSVLPLSKKQKCACNIVTGATLVVAGLLLALAGGGVIHAPVKTIVAPTVLFAVGLSVLISAVIGKNSLSMWLAGVIICCGVPSLINAVSGVAYSVTYPVYIAAPGIACLLAICFSETWFPQVKGGIFFCVIAGLFALASNGVTGYGLAGGLVAAFIGLCVIALGAQSYFKKDNNENA